jgi:L-asparaginase
MANVSQSVRGSVDMGLYETSARLVEAGFVAASDITLEAAQTKLMSLLGSFDDLDAIERQQIVENEFQRDIAGEMSMSTYVTDFGYQSGGILKSAVELPERTRIRSVTVEGSFSGYQMVRAILRLRGVNIRYDPEDYITIRVFLNLDPDEEIPDASASARETYRRWVTGDDGLLLFDVTPAVRDILTPGDRLSVTLVLDTSHCEITWQRAELAVFVEE